MAESQKKYIINGVEYDSLDQVPEEHRSSFEAFEKITSTDKPELGQVLDALFSSIPGSDPSNNSSNEIRKDTRMQDGGGFFSSPHFKIMIAVLIVGVIAYLVLMNFKESPQENQAITGSDTVIQEQEESPADEMFSANNESQSSQHFSLLIDDPNEPPYQMFVGLYDHEKLLLRVDLPYGELEETNEENVISINVPVEEGTNLAGNRIILKWEEEWATDESWTEVTLGANTFFTFLEDDYGAGQHYVTRYYVYPYNGGAVIISGLYHLQNVDIMENNAEIFDVEKDLKQLEELLATLKETE